MKCCNHISLNISLLCDVTPYCLIYTKVTKELAASVLYQINRPFYQTTFVKSQTKFVYKVTAEKSPNTYHIYLGRSSCKVS